MKRLPSGYYNPQMRRCYNCGKLIITGKARDLAKDHLYCSQECAAAGRQRTEWPPSTVIAGLLRNYPVSYVAKKLKVSDTAVRKFCSKHRVALPKRGYWAKRYAKEGLPHRKDITLLP